MRRLLYFSIVLAACGDDSSDGPFGPSTIIVAVNPPANTGNTATPPASVGTMQADIEVNADPGGSAVTDATGLAVITEDLDPGNVSLVLGGGPSVSGSITSEGDVYDYAIAYNGTAAQLYPGFPIRYSVGGTVVQIASDADATSALSTDSTVAFFDEGSHVGDLKIEGSNVVLFGATDVPVVIEGNVEVRGSNVRLRGVTITGNLSVFGNGFGMSFSVVRGATQLNGQSIAFLGNVFCGGATVPSSNAAVFDNEGIAPLPRPPAPICP